MKKTIVALVFASLFPLTAFAQTGPHVGADAEIAIPLGNFSDGAGVGFGGLLRYEFTVVPNANITARAGFVYHLSKEVQGTTLKFWTIPVLGGLRLAVGESVYVKGEAGLFVNHGSTDGGGFSTSKTEYDFGITLGGGYRVGPVELGLALHILDLGHAGDTLALVANLGYNF